MVQEAQIAAGSKHQAVFNEGDSTTSRSGSDGQSQAFNALDLLSEGSENTALSGTDDSNSANLTLAASEGEEQHASDSQYPPKLELVSQTDGPEEASAKNALEAIDSADANKLDKMVKGMHDNPEAIKKLAQDLNKELSAYGMSAEVSSHTGTTNLTLRHSYEVGDERYNNSITFSSKPGANASENSFSETISGPNAGMGGGGGGPVRTTEEGKAVSRTLRKMSHDRTH